MKLCTFEVHTSLGRHARLGAVVDAGIVDLNFACAWHLASRGESRPYPLADVLVPDAMLPFLEGGDTCLGFARATIDHLCKAGAGEHHPEGLNGETLLYPPSNVRLLAPLPRPASLRDFYAVERHVRAGFEKRGEPMPREWYEIPVYYKGNHQAIIGPDEPVEWPAFTEKFDYELEIAFVIGRAGRDIAASDAMRHVAGFTIMNDFSARDMQRTEMRVRLGPAKGKDWATALGPVLVTTDELGDPYNLAMTARVNGEVWSQGNTGEIFWRFEQMIEFASKGEMVYPGDVFGSGTVGTGCGLELDRWVQPGDLIELEIERIGVLRSRVVRATTQG